MKKYLLLLSLLFVTLLSADTYVDGYTKSNGTYVEGHYRSSPNDTVSDNYSTEGNVNPYTDEEGNRDVYDDGGYDATTQPLADTGNASSADSNKTVLIILGVLGGLILLLTILRALGKIMFFSHLAANAKFAFTTWVILTIVNQIVFFGACLAPYCILASIPHVSLITLGIMYLSYTTARDTYDPQTGYNKFGYNKDGYDKYGYGADGYDKNGYNSQGLDRDGKDRLGKGSIGRFFAGSEHQKKVSKMNEEAIKKNLAAVLIEPIQIKKPAMTIEEDSEEKVSKVNVDYSVDKILKDLGIDSKIKDSLDAKTARIQKELADINTKKRSNNMPIRINNNPLNNYKNVSDQAKDVKNFRLYFKDKPTNLVWYGGKIIYVPKDYFLMQNLVNIHHATGRKCILYKPEVNLIDEMSEKNIIFTLAEDIEELMNRLNASGLNKTMLLSDELGVETTSDVDYSEFDESIYDEDGSWNIKS